MDDYTHAQGLPIPVISNRQHGPVAPMEERLPCKEKVVGSNPTWSTAGDERTGESPSEQIQRRRIPNAEGT